MAGPFVDRLLAAGFDFFAGVPCSLVGPVIAELTARGRYLGETREDAALGVAAGAYLGGRRPMVVMQNSGLGVSLNALGSLHILYELPVLLLVTWRGYQGKDAPEHLVMGEVLTGLLYVNPDADDLRARFERAGLRSTFTPLYGNTPFNNWRVVAERD